jgi:hypothetical protein
VEDRFDAINAINLWLAKDTNLLRKSTFSELERMIDSPRRWTRPFHARTVALAAIADRGSDGSLIVLTRAFVLPYFLTRTLFWNGFTKLPDNSWRKWIDDSTDALGDRLNQLVPII